MAPNDFVQGGQCECACSSDSDFFGFDLFDIMGISLGVFGLCVVLCCASFGGLLANYNCTCVWRRTEQHKHTSNRTMCWCDCCQLQCACVIGKFACARRRVGLIACNLVSATTSVVRFAGGSARCNILQHPLRLTAAVLTWISRLHCNMPQRTLQNVAAVLTHRIVFRSNCKSDEYSSGLSCPQFPHSPFPPRPLNGQARMTRSHVLTTSARTRRSKSRCLRLMV